MLEKLSAYISAAALALTLTACAAPGGQPGEVEIRSGVIEQITPVQLQNNQNIGVGAVVGGLAGLGIGSLQIIVRTTNGVLVSVTQPVNPALRQGQKVYVEGSGEDARVVPR